MNRHLNFNRIIALACMNLTALGVARAWAEDAKKDASPNATAPDQWVVEVVELKHASAPYVASSVKQILPGINGAALNDHTVALSGPRAGVDMVIAKVIHAVDVSDESSAQADIVPVKNYPVNELMPLLRTVAPRATFGIDEVNRTVVVQGDDRDRKAVHAALQTLDQPSRSARLQLFFLRGDISAAPAASESNFPSDLAPVGKTLNAAGFGHLSLLAPMMIAAQEGKSFESKSRLRSPASTPEENIEFNARGTVRLMQPANTAQVNIAVSSNGSYALGAEGGLAPTRFELETTVELKLGEYVLLSAAPSSSATGGAIALVVRVTAD
ncbi:MAG: hypothetical protein HY287_10505 [Planctomycetes bacterium]|nr:hypothetical protein [Planctomycetota bacterium]